MLLQFIWGGVLLQPPLSPCSGTPQRPKELMADGIWQITQGIRGFPILAIGYTLFHFRLPCADSQRHLLMRLGWHSSCSTTLRKKCTMSRTYWLLLGAVLVGIAVAVYLIFFCPTECH